MNQNPKIKKIKQLILNSIFLTAEQKEDWLEKINLLSEADTANLLVFLEQAQEKQNAIITNLAQHNPTFLDELHHFQQKLLMRLYRENEEGEKQIEQKTEANLLKKAENF